MGDYGPKPKVMRINPTPEIRRMKKRGDPLARLEDALMGRLIYYAGNAAGKQAAMLAFKMGVQDKEKLRFIKNFAQDKARNDTHKLLEELREDQGSLPNVTIEAREPEVVNREEIYNVGLRQLREDNI